MCAVFVPGIVLRSYPWKPVDFENYFDSAIIVLAIIISTNFSAARFLGLGESYHGFGQSRYFGFLGDSFSPVIIFPMLYFLILRRWFWASLMIFSLFLTVAKAALGMAAAAVIIHFLLRLPTPIRFAAVGFLLLGSPLVYTMLIDPMLKSLLANEVFQYSFNSRMLSMEVGWRTFQENPLFGIGINRSMNYMRYGSEQLANWHGVSRYYPVGQIDNPFVRVLAETGMLGFSAIVLFCIVVLRRSFIAITRVASAPPSKSKAFAIAGGVWSVSFVTVYQTTGWFEQGHPQLSWLVIICSLAYVASTAANGAQYQLLQSASPVADSVRSVVYRVRPGRLG